MIQKIGQVVIKTVKNKYFIGGACVVLAGCLAFWLIPQMNSKTREVIQVLRVREKVEANTLMDRSMFRLEEVGAYGQPKDILTDAAAVEGKFSAVDLLPGDNLTADKFIDSQALQDNGLYTLDDENLAVSVSVSSLAAGVSGKLRAGDVVRVFAVLRTDENSYEVQQYPELLYLELLGITDSKARDTDNEGFDGVTATALLSCTPDQAERLVEIEALGRVHLAFVGRGERYLELVKTGNGISLEDTLGMQDDAWSEYFYGESDTEPIEEDVDTEPVEDGAEPIEEYADTEPAEEYADTDWTVPETAPVPAEPSETEGE